MLPPTGISRKIAILRLDASPGHLASSGDLTGKSGRRRYQRRALQVVLASDSLQYIEYFRSAM
jgi:hypothetical protein